MTTTVTPRVRPRRTEAMEDKKEESVKPQGDTTEGAQQETPSSEEDTKQAKPKWNLQIEDLTDVEELLKMLFYGPPGVGKTVLAASAKDVVALSPVLLVDFEGGTRSIQDRK